MRQYGKVYAQPEALGEPVGQEGYDQATDAGSQQCSFQGENPDHEKDGHGQDPE